MQDFVHQQYVFRILKAKLSTFNQSRIPSLAFRALHWRGKQCIKTRETYYRAAQTSSPILNLEPYKPEQSPCIASPSEVSCQGFENLIAKS